MFTAPIGLLNPKSVAAAFPVYESNGGFASAVTSFSVNVSYPSTVNADDILIAQLMDADNDDFATPAGWTKIVEHTAHANLSDALFWRRATGSESGTVTFTSSSSSGGFIGGIISRFSGCVTSGTPYEGLQSAGITSSASATVPAITTTGSERLVISCLQVEDDVSIATATDYTESFFVSAATGSGGAIKLQSQEVATASTTTARTSSLGATDFWGSFGIALIPV